ncbi:MAG: hypothetical protein RJB39_637 [Candidatus Parcubacteria bacterium]|jgi:glutaredoxin-like YruB-family protein
MESTTSKKITVYSTENCKYCHLVKEYLTEKGFAYTSVDVGKDAEARKVAVEKSGQLGVPVVDIDNNIVVGFDKDILDQLLGLTPAVAN